MYVNWLEIVFCFNKLGIHRRPDEEYFINETQEVVRQCFLASGKERQ